MVNIETKYSQIIEFLKKEVSYKPDLTLVLGSGLGKFADKIKLLFSIKTSDIPGYPLSSIIGHAGLLHLGKLNRKIVLIFQGRIHFYEGYSLSQCILPVFISNKLGCKNIILTNAAGGVNKEFVAGDFMLAESVNSFFIKKELTELIGLASVEGKNNFMQFPSAYLNKKIESAAAKENIRLKKGVYWFNKGPSYETPAEIRMVELYGGDAVGMSTVHEAIYSSYLGMNTSVISCITNLAAGISNNKLSHTEVTETAFLVQEKFEKLLKQTIVEL